MGKPTKKCIKHNSAVGPSFCGTCSRIIQDYVQWEGHTVREALLIHKLSPILETGFRWIDKSYKPVYPEW